jgi:hypothetical protein
MGVYASIAKFYPVIRALALIPSHCSAQGKLAGVSYRMVIFLHGDFFLYRVFPSLCTRRYYWLLGTLSLWAKQVIFTLYLPPSTPTPNFCCQRQEVSKSEGNCGVCKNVCKDAVEVLWFRGPELMPTYNKYTQDAFPRSRSKCFLSPPHSSSPCVWGCGINVIHAGLGT